LASKGYHPRSSKHGDALCEYILSDLIEYCPTIKAHATSGQIVYESKRSVRVGGSDWNIDLVLGPPPAGYKKTSAANIDRVLPSTFRIAIEAKTIMTEHGKARRNRHRDLDQFQEFMRRYDVNTVSAAVTVVNMADRFKSQLRPEETQHSKNIVKLVTDTVDMFRGIPTRSAPEQNGLDANAVIVIEHDNIDNTRTKLVTKPPAPQTSDPLAYHSFLQRICDRYTQRWGK
jgi:hypothetical protein